MSQEEDITIVSASDLTDPITMAERWKSYSDKFKAKSEFAATKLAFSTPTSLASTVLQIEIKPPKTKPAKALSIKFDDPHTMTVIKLPIPRVRPHRRHD